MGRLIKLLWVFWTSSIASEMEYRLNFVIASLTAVGNLVGSVFALSLFYRGGYELGGWSFEEALVVLGVFTLLLGVSETLLTPNLNNIVRQVQEGTLDFVLIKPVDSQLWVSARAISLWGVPNLLLGFGLLFYAGDHLELGVSAGARLAIPLGCAVVSLYSLWFMLGATSIWFVKIYNVTEVLKALLEAGRFPMSAFPVGLRFVFTFVVPVALLTTVPAESFLGRSETPLAVASAAVVALGLAFLARRFWRFALGYYTSASS